MNNYYGVDSSRSLKHWKYVKKVRKNGKWVYYYKKLKSDINKAVGIDAKKKRDLAELKYTVANINAQKSKNAYNEAYYNAIKDNKITESERNTITKYGEQKHKDIMTVRYTGKQYLTAKSNYLLTPLGKAEEFIKDGKSLIRSLFTKVGKGN